MQDEVEWFTQDLNETLRLGKRFGMIVCSETIELLEYPRQVFRTLAELLVPGGTLVLTMPNQERTWSYVGLILGVHSYTTSTSSEPPTQRTSQRCCRWT